MKSDFRQFLSFLYQTTTNLYPPHQSAYRYATDDAAKILKSISQEEDYFQIYTIWIYIGKLFIYALHESKNEMTLDCFYELCLLHLVDTKEPDLLEAGLEIEVFICETIFKSTIQIEEILTCMRLLGVSLREIRGFTLTVLALNEEVTDVHFLKDTLLPTLLMTENEESILNTQTFYSALKSHIKEDKIKLYHDHYQLF